MFNSLARRVKVPGAGRKRQRGAVLAETAIVLPLLVVLILATAEFSNAFWQYSTLTKMVRDGARYAATQGLLGSTGVVVLTNELRAEVGNVVVYGNTAGSGSPSLSGMQASAVTLEAPGDGDIIVRANYAYQPLFGVVPTFYGSNATAPLSFDAAVRMRAL
jgi:Flp pilus assembly protein TadG